MEDDLEKEELAKFHKRKRKRHRIFLTILTILFLVISIILLSYYYILNKKSFIKYNETSNIQYGVDILENEFYTTDHLEENIDVIANLIKNINVTLKYNLNLSEEVDYKYNYRIVSNIELKEKGKTNLIYSNDEEILNTEIIESNNKRLEISESLNIDYNYYNEQINKLIEAYKLDNTESKMSLTMYLDIINKETGARINKDTNVMSLVIPLNTKTVEITANENIKDAEGEIVIEPVKNENSKYYLTFGVILLVSGIITLISLIRYNLRTRGSEKMYEDELKKILFDYKSYIQKTNTKIDYKKYKIIRIETFNELINMREDIQAPILMYSEKNNLKTIFMMIKEDILYAYILSAKQIKEKLIEESKKKKEQKDEKNK